MVFVRIKHSTVNAITALTSDSIKALEEITRFLVFSCICVKPVIQCITKYYYRNVNTMESEALNSGGLRVISQTRYTKCYVKYNNNVSIQQDITYAVPQGSILGPLLLIVYINYLFVCK